MEHAQSTFHPKICILSAAGGCGKTTLAVNLFRPFLENPLMLFMGPFPEKMFSLRGMEAHFMRGSEVDDMVVQIVMYADRPVIADIRMNVVEAFLAGIRDFLRPKDALFDLFVIPVTADPYSLHRGMWTADRLHAVNVPWEKILFLPARVKEGAEKDALSAVRQAVRDHYAEGTGPLISEEGFIEENPIFDDMYGAGVCLADLSEIPDAPGRWSLCNQSERAAEKRVPALVRLEGKMDYLRPRMERVFREVMTYLPESSRS